MYRRHTDLRLVMLMLASLIYSGQVLAEDLPEAKRPKTWAQPVELPGTPNLHKVSDVLYRSAQPTGEGMQQLEKKMGLKTVVNLRGLHSDRDELEGTQLQYMHIRIRTWRMKEKYVLRFLKQVLDPSQQPVLVHCWHGADRTGTMAAFYRMVVQGWSKKEALREMTQGGFSYHSVWTNLIDFNEEADIPEYRRKLGIPEPNKPKDPKEPKK